MQQGFDITEEAARTALSHVAHGSEEALELLYRAYAPAVLAFVRARVADPLAAEEVAADTWLGCWRSAAGFRGESRVLTWLLSIAKRHVYMRVRKKHIPLCPLDDEARGIPDDADSPEDAVIAQAGVEELMEAIGALPPELCETVRFAWLYGLSYAEIANISDVAEGTVKSRVSRARRLLRERLKRHES